MPNTVRLEMKTDELYGQFINTIKFVRWLTGWGLKESKDFCEDLKLKHPAPTSYSSDKSYQFDIPTTITHQDILNKAMDEKLFVEIKVAPITEMPPDFKGCFNMVSASVVHIYLENGENNKLSMNVPISKMQDIINMFAESCR